MKFKDGEVDASFEEIAVYNMVFAQAMFDVLVSSGLLDGEAVREKIKEIQAQTKIKLNKPN